MTSMRRFLIVLFLLALAFAPAASLCAQTAPASQPSVSQRIRAAVAHDEHMDIGETNSQIEEYRHSAEVAAVGRWFHLSTDTAANVAEDINSAIILLCVFLGLWKFLPKIFRQRSERLSKALVEARRETEEANRKLAEVEARLARLDAEIESIRQQVEKDAAGDEQRIHATLEAERQRIVASAEQEIAAAQAGAQRELKKFAADLAIDHAMRRVQLSAETDRALVKDFGGNLGGKPGGEA